LLIDPVFALQAETDKENPVSSGIEPKSVVLSGSNAN